MHTSKKLKRVTLVGASILIISLMALLFFRSPTITGNAVTIKEGDLPEDVLSTGYYAIDASFTKKIDYNPNEYVKLEEYIRKSDGLLGIVKDNENTGKSLDESINIAISELNKRDIGFYFIAGACSDDEDSMTTTPNIFEQRTRRFCAQSQKKILYYDSTSKKISYSRILYKFALFFPDAKPPKKVQNVMTHDLKTAQDRIILMWDAVDEEDIEQYQIYYSNDKISDKSLDELENPMDPKDAPNKIIFKLSEKEEHTSFDPEEKPQCKKEAPSICNYLYDLGDAKIGLEDKKLYYVSSSNRYFTILNVNDREQMEFLVNAVDASGNRRDNENLPLGFYSGESIDDLAPSNIRQPPNINLEEDKIDITFEKPSLNTDGSDIDDLIELAFFKSDDSFNDLRAMTPFLQVNLEKKGCYLADQTCTISLSLDSFPKNKKFYLAVAGVDEEDNYYEDLVFSKEAPIIPTVTS